MKRKILDFRLRQFGRMLKEIGAVYFILLILVCFGFFLGLIESLVRSTSPWIGLIGGMIISSIHFSRKDGNFLKKLEINRPQLFMLEYFFLTGPLTLIFLTSGNWGAIILQSLFVLIFAFLPHPGIDGKSFSNRLNFRFLPKEAFEIRTFLRKAAIPIIFVYLAGLITTKYLTIPIVIVILTALMFTAFFDELEGKMLFEAIHFRKDILAYKIKMYLTIYLLVLMPYFLLFAYWHLAYWYILLAAVFIGITLILFNIFYKYAHYAPHRKRVYNSVANSIFFLAVIIPFFYPVTLLYLIYYWRKARKNIRLYYAEN